MPSRCVLSRNSVLLYAESEGITVCVTVCVAVCVAELVNTRLGIGFRVEKVAGNNQIAQDISRP